MTRILLLVLALGVGCAQRGQRSAKTATGALYWEYETSDGIPDGRSTTYFPDGTIRSDGFYLRAMRHGNFVAYNRSGDIIKKALFWYDVLLWTTENPKEEPPATLLLALRKLSDPVEIRRRYGGPKKFVHREPFVAFDLGSPLGTFVSNDRQVRSGNRLELQLGAGGNTASATAARHFSLFGRMQHREFGAFFQFDGSRVANTGGVMSETASGRQTLEGGGVYEISDRFGQLSSRFSMVVPLHHDDAQGFLAAAATSYQRPADAILSQPASIAFRGSSSWVLQGNRWVMQTDVGFDTAFGGAPGYVPVYGRLNSSLGLGIRSAIALMEFSSSAQLNDLDRRLYSIGLGMAIGGRGVAVKWLVSRTSGDFWTYSLGSEYAF